MLSQILEIKGLHTDPSLVSRPPDGALQKAENIVLSRRGLAEPVRGMDRFYKELPGSDDARVRAMCAGENGILGLCNNHLFYFNPEQRDQPVKVAGIVKPHEHTTFINFSGRYYFPTSEGLRCFETRLRPSGVKMPCITACTKTTSSENSKGLLKANYVRAYRIVCGISEENRTVYGPPSVMEVAHNRSDSDMKIKLEFILPSASNGFYEIYATSDISMDEVESPETYYPEDETYLIHRKSYNSENRFSGVFTDNKDRSLTGNTLYTSASQEGILNANTPPPSASDICIYKGCLFFANTRLIEHVTAKISTELQSQVILKNFVFEISEEEREPETQGDGQALHFIAKQNNDFETAKRLCTRIFETTSFEARVISLYFDPPEILVENGFSRFTLILAKNQSILRTIPSKNASSPDSLRFSKYLEPEAVPVKNFLTVGSGGKVLRIVSLRDSLIVFKSEGIFRLYGNDEHDFGIDTIDSTMKLIAPASVAVLNNTVFFLSDQGVIAITETDTRKVSSEIDADLRPLTYNPEARKHIFALAYQQEYRYYLFTEQFGAYVYHLKSGQWTTWRKAAESACIYNGRIWLGSPREKRIEFERKDFFFSDFIDYDSTLNLNKYNRQNNILVDHEKKCNEGDYIFDKAQDSYHQILTTKDRDLDKLVYLESDISGTEQLHLFKPVRSVIEWLPFHGESPTFIKQFQNIKLIFDDHGIKNMDGKVSFKTDLDQHEVSRTFKSRSSSPLWGKFPFGGILLSDKTEDSDDNLRPVMIPRAMQRGHRITVRFEAKSINSTFELAGIAIAYRNISDKGIRYGSNPF